MERFNSAKLSPIFKRVLCHVDDKVFVYVYGVFSDTETEIVKW
jgi:hypothetical protein